MGAHLAIDIDVQWFPEDPSGNFRHTLVLAEGRAGLAGHHFEVRNEGARGIPAFDVGGRLELYRRKVVFRLDVEDTILPFGAAEIPRVNGSSRPGTAHAYHVAIGVGVCFGPVHPPAPA